MPLPFAVYIEREERGADVSMANRRTSQYVKKLFVTLLFWEVRATATSLTPPTPLPVSSKNPGAVVLDTIDVYGKRGNQAYVIDPLRNRF